MSVSFDWEFEEEKSDARQPGESVPPPNRRRRWLLRGAVLVALLAVVGLSARAWINNRLNAVEKVEAELRSLVELELKHIADGDAELFRARQDPIIHRWRDRQVDRYISQPALFVPVPGLLLDDHPTEIQKVSVFGHTGRAELIRWFTPPGPGDDPDPGPLPFQITWFYRLDEDGTWYHTAPPDDYWGTRYSWHGTWLDIQATQVEAKMLDTVANDLTLLVFKACRRLDCPRDTRYTLSFEGTLFPLMHGNKWTLPALYLTGLPEDEKARDAWVNMLKPWLVEALVQSRVTRTEVIDRILYRHLVAYLQAALGLDAPTAPDIEVLAQALSQGRQHSLQSLWQTVYDPSFPEEMRLLDAEVKALLQWLGTQVGPERVVELLPAMQDFSGFDSALSAIYGLEPDDFRARWLAHLSELTGVATELPPTATASPQLEPPPLPPEPPVIPGNQIAYICSGRIWVSNADGSNAAPLTATGESFCGLHWSPDGRWLLTAWLSGGALGPVSSTAPRAIYLLSADGNEGRLLTNDPTLGVWPLGWSPDGQEAIYYAWRNTTSGNVMPETWATNIETNETRQLPSAPIWSPDGEHLVYAAEPFNGSGSSLWLAGANWENARQIADQGNLLPEQGWSPDSSRLAWVRHDQETGVRTIVTYDLNTEQLTPLVRSDDLIAAVRSAEGDFVTDDADPAALEGKALQGLWVSGWSADGNRLLALAEWQGNDPSTQPLAVLALLPLDSPSLQVLAFGQGGLPGLAAWSPTEPDRFTFVWPTGLSRYAAPNTYLFDLQTGPIYTGTQKTNATWSPGGVWVAFTGQDGVTIVDQAGQKRSDLGHGDPCFEVAWNPAADLSTMARAITLISSTQGWGFANVRIYHDREARSLHIMGEVVNHTGYNQRINALGFALPTDRADNQMTAHAALPGSEGLMQAANLADDRSLPFSFTVSLPNEVQLGEDSEALVSVATGSAEPIREDLEILTDTFDLSAWPAAFHVSGAWENPGPDLTEYAVIVVTAYGEDGRVIGWDWFYETDPANLSGGVHDFEVEITLPEIVAKLQLEVYSYKIQLFGY